MERDGGGGVIVEGKLWGVDTKPRVAPNLVNL